MNERSKHMANIGSNSGGCATESMVMSLGGSNALVHPVSTQPIAVVIALQGGEDAIAPEVVGTPALVVQNMAYPLRFEVRHVQGRRATELWWLVPPTPTGSPMVYQLVANLSAPAYAHAVLVNVSEATGLRKHGFSGSEGAAYATLIQGTNPQSAVLSYLNGALGTDLGGLDHFCGSGGFVLHLDSQPATPGDTMVSGAIVQGIGASDWLHSAWELS